jgi:hypothetical protein
MSRYLNVPLVGEFFIERTSRPLGRTVIDGAINKGGIELFIGKTHLIMDKPQTNAIPAISFGLVLFAAMLHGGDASAHVETITECLKRRPGI